MASNLHPGARGGGYGLDADLANKHTQKSANASEAEQQAIAWIQGCTGLAYSGSFAAWLKDGTVLCTLVNALRPGSVRKINQSTMPFKQMENIKNFLEASRALGVQPYDCFETVDLYEEKDLVLVAQTVHALGSAVQKSIPTFSGPKLGSKKADKNVRIFTAEQRANQAKGAAFGTLATSGSAGIMERTALSTSNDINFGTKSAGGVGTSGATAQTMGSHGIMERGNLNVSNDINFGNRSAGGSGTQGVLSAQTMGSAGIMERGTLNVSNDINFGSKSAGVGSSVSSAQTMGSHGIMQRGAVNVSNDINFGSKSAGVGSNVSSAQTMGSHGIMQRGALNVSNDINFGSKSAGGVGSSVPSAQTQGSSGVMQRGGINTSNDVNFGAKASGDPTIFDGMTKLSVGSQGVMQRGEINTSNSVTFGNTAGQQAPVLQPDGGYVINLVLGEGQTAGKTIQVQGTNGTAHSVTVPEGLSVGDTLTIRVGAPK
jgi:hypothetical protein